MDNQQRIQAYLVDASFGYKAIREKAYAKSYGLPVNGLLRINDMNFEFDNTLVDKVSEFLQAYLKNNSLKFLTADESAELLAEHNILNNNIGPKPGFNFRQMLRDGRDGHINIVTGAYQSHPRARWFIYNKT